MQTNLIIYFLTTVCFSNIAIADEQIYVREYTYQASEADSKITARAIALQEVKRELLSELGTHVSSLVKLQSSSDGTNLGTEEIETLSAGVTSVEILDEKWNGTVYVLKAQIKTDPADVLKSLTKMLDAGKKQKQISQLDGELSKVRNENIQIAESLTQTKKENTAALAEIARLKKQLEEKQTEASRQILQTAYQQQVNQLTLNEWLDTAFGYYFKGNFPEAFRLFQKAANQGDAKAQFWLGSCYYRGEGVDKNMKEAAKWFGLSAEQGDRTAQSILGGLYYIGEGVQKNYKEAMKWYQLAAEQGNPFAQYILGYMYSKGIGVETDTEQGLKWYRLAALQGNADAQIMLGDWYSTIGGLQYFGEYILKNGTQSNYPECPKKYCDSKEAMKWYQLAAEQGNAEGQYSLAVMYSTNKDYKTALKWKRLSAMQGNSNAQDSLGYTYENGEGVPQDFVRAFMWVSLAAFTADTYELKSIIEHRDSIKVKMNSKQIAAAQKLFRECTIRKFKGC